MYDKVRLWIDRFEIEEGVWNNLPNTLSNVSDKVDRATGEWQTEGQLCNLYVRIKETGLQVSGSLSRFFHWEKDNGRRGNLYPLNRHDTKKAVGKLSEWLGGVPIDRAKVRALEFGSVVSVSVPVSECLKRFGSFPRLERVMRYEDSLSYRHRGVNKPKEIAFYDKRADARAKGYALPKGMGDSNLLKYELRLNGSVGKQLKWGEVTGATLYDREFYKRVTETYMAIFMKVEKLPQGSVEVKDTIKTTGDAVDVLLSRLLRQLGAEVIDSYVEELKSRQTFPQRANYSRLRKKLTGILSKTSTREDDSVLMEIEDGVRNMCSYV